MKDYEFKYEAPPVSEITKSKIISAIDIFKAAEMFKRDTPEAVEVFSINLI